MHFNPYKDKLAYMSNHNIPHPEIKSNEKDDNTIIRTQHDRNRPYVVLNKETLENPNLSWEAKGLWSYLMSRPDNWSISVQHLRNIFKERGGGRDAIRGMLLELRKEGYLEKVTERQAKGKFGQTLYILHELKIKVPRTALPAPAKRPLISKDNNISPISRKNIYKDNVLEKPPKDPPTKTSQKKTMSSYSKNEKTLDITKRYRINKEQEQIYLWLKDKKINTEDKTLAYWSKTYSQERLSAVINEASKKERRNLGGFINTLLKSNACIPDENVVKNTQFADDFKKQNQWSELKIKKTHVQIGSHWDLSLNIDPVTFAKQLMSKLK